MRSRRDTELLLILAAAPAIALLFALVHGAARATVTWQDFAVPLGLLVAFLGAHVAARYFAPGADPVLLPIVFALTGTGLAFMTRLDTGLAASQVVWVFGGVLALVVTLAVVPSLEHLARYKYTIALVGVILLVAPAIIGVEVNGAKLWLRFAGMSFQPAEVAKVLIVIFLAAYLAENREVLSVSTKRVLGIWLPPLKHLGPVVFMWMLSLVVLVAEKDLGSSLLFFGLFLVMIYAATGRTSYVIVGLGLFACRSRRGISRCSTHVQTRVAIWLDPFADATGRGYQLVQSLFAFAAGGMIGVGPGKGLPDRIPFIQTDFIFAAIGEELGLIGGAAIILAYLVFCLRGLATGTRARSDMAAFTAVGLVAAFGLQTFVILGGVTRLIPLTGITLPFISYGGSSILANFILLALLMRAGDSATGREAEMVSTAATGVLGRVAIGRRLTAVAIVLAALLGAVIANLTYLQVFAAPALAANPANTRGLAEELRQERGAIITRDAVMLAESVPAGSVFARRVPGGVARCARRRLLQRAVRAGGRRSRHERGACRQAVFRQRRRPGELARRRAGTRQRRAAHHRQRDPEGRREGARRTSAARASSSTRRPVRCSRWQSSPAYDPATVDEEWATLSSGAAAPLVNRAAQSLYPPGSTFKIVTLTGAIGSGIATPARARSPVRRASRSAARRSPTTAVTGTARSRSSKATASSINTVYAQLADKLGAERLVAQSERFGINNERGLRVAAQDVAHARPRRDDAVGDRVGGRGPARRRAREPRRAAGHGASDGARLGGHRQRRRRHAAVRGRLDHRPRRRGPLGHDARGSG